MPDCPRNVEAVAVVLGWPATEHQSRFKLIVVGVIAGKRLDQKTFAHVWFIDLGYFAEIAKEDGMIKLQDAIVTTLFRVSPETLASFLSPTVNTFKAVFGKKDVQLVIWRKGLEVFVSGRQFIAGPLLTAL